MYDRRSIDRFIHRSLNDKLLSGEQKWKCLLALIFKSLRFTEFFYFSNDECKCEVCDTIYVSASKHSAVKSHTQTVYHISDVLLSLRKRIICSNASKFPITFFPFLDSNWCCWWFVYNCYHWIFIFSFTSQRNLIETLYN